MEKKNFKRIAVVLMIVVLALVLTGCSSRKKVQELNLMTWGGGDFIPRVVIDQFTEETGIKVNYKEVSSNEEMQSLLEANPPDQYDLAVVTDYMVDILRQNGNLAVLDHSQMPNYANINPVYFGPPYYDPKDEHSIPYAVSISFLLVNPEGGCKAWCSAHHRL